MLDREQSDALLMAYNRVRDIDHPLGSLPREVVMYKMNITYNSDPDSEIAIALRLAADSQEKAIKTLVKMIKKNPSLLLQAGDVISRGGYPAARKTLIAFLLSEGDPAAAKRIEFGFKKIPDGEKIREFQYKEYEPHIKILKTQIESKIPAYNLIPLFDALINISFDNFKEAFKQNTNYESNSKMSKEMQKFVEEMQKFIDAIKLKRKADDMHYKHYTTLMQAFDLRHEKWRELSNNNSNYDKCDFLWGQVIWRLQYNLPAVDRFAFARAFMDEKRTVTFIHDGDGTFPDAEVNEEPEVIQGGNFGLAIYGCAIVCHNRLGVFCSKASEVFGKHMSNKSFFLESLCNCSNQPINRPRPTGV